MSNASKAGNASKYVWCAIRMRIDCPECGGTILVDGPYETVRCVACKAKVPLTNVWEAVVGWALHSSSSGKKFKLNTVLRSGPGELGLIYLATNKGRPPVCPACDTSLGAVDAGVPTGTSGVFHCPSCGAEHPTWPAKGYLKRAKVLQVFLSPTEADSQKVLAGEAGEAKPITFHCPTCSAALKITGTSQRVSTCEYCDADAFLPAELWNRLHPVRRRRAFWLRCKAS